MEEIWKDIKGYEGLYQVSDQGRIRSVLCDSHRRKRILKPSIVRGYYNVLLYKDNKRVMKSVHRLVAEAFVPNDDPEHKTQCNHINEDKLDCRALNLNWLSPKGNTNWGTGIKRRINTKTKKGIYGGKKQVKQLSLDGKVVYIWSSASEAGKNGYCQSAISSCCQGKRKTHLGYRWVFA